MSKLFVLLPLVLLVIVSGCVSERPPEVTGGAASPATPDYATPVLQSGVNVATADAAKSLFAANSEVIVNNTVFCQLQLNSSRTNYNELWNARDVIADYPVAYKQLNYYVVEVPIVRKNLQWHYNGTGVVVDEVGSVPISGNPSQSCVENDPQCRPVNVSYPAQSIRYLITGDGNVYFAGEGNCSVTALAMDSFYKYRSRYYLSAWTNTSLVQMPSEAEAKSIPSECEGNNRISYMNANADLIMEAKVENIYTVETGHEWKNNEAYLAIQSVTGGVTNASKIILRTRIGLDENPALVVGKTYKLYMLTLLSNYEDPSKSYTTYWLMCGLKSIVVV